MKTYFYSTYITQCHIDSTSVAYKQSEEEDRHLEISTCQGYRSCMEPRASNIKTWKHESILLYFYSTYKTQCHFDSTSVAYKQSEEEDI